MVQPRLEPEAVLPLTEIGGEFYQVLSAMEQFGNGNDHPRFIVKGIQLVQYKPHSSLLRSGKYAAFVSHREDAKLIYTNAPHDYLVEVIPQHLILRGVAA
jgi:single-stranded DNA-specific DHH superfamily exonuclease